MTTLAIREVHDPKEWNHALERLPGAGLRQGWEWGALRAGQGWQPMRVAAFDDAACVAACALQRRWLPGVGTLMYAPRGPVVAEGRHDAAAQLLDRIVAVARAGGAAVVRVSPPCAAAGVEAALALAGFLAIEDTATTWNTPRQTQALELAADEATLLRGMRRRVREYVSAGRRRGLVVEPTRRDDDLVAFHALLVATGRLKGIPVRDLAYYRAMLDRYEQAGTALLLVVRLGGAVVGGALGVRFGGEMTMLHTSVRSGVAETVRHAIAPVMFWEMIRRAKRDGCVRLDLGSSGVQLTAQPTDRGWGVYRFKAGLGARPEVAPAYRDLVLAPARYRLLRLAERRLLPSLWRLAAQRVAAGLVTVPRATA